jgi:DNA-binding transcriptional ArsR family regulator
LNSSNIKFTGGAAGYTSAELDKIAVAAEYLGIEHAPEQWTVELLEQKRARMREQVGTLRAFADESRMDIFLFLMHRGTTNGEMGSFTVSEIAERMQISLSTVSHHLQELKRVGLLKVERQGKERYYRVDLDYLIDIVENLYQKLLKKRELIQQGIPGCPTELLVEFVTKNLNLTENNK